MPVDRIKRRVVLLEAGSALVVRYGMAVVVETRERAWKRARVDVEHIMEEAGPDLIEPYPTIARITRVGAIVPLRIFLCRRQLLSVGANRLLREMVEAQHPADGSRKRRKLTGDETRIARLFVY